MESVFFPTSYCSYSLVVLLCGRPIRRYTSLDRLSVCPSARSSVPHTYGLNLKTK